MFRRVAKQLAAASVAARPGGTAAPRTFTSSSARATTVLCVRKDGDVVLMADGQVTLGSQVVIGETEDPWSVLLLNMLH